MRKLLRVVVITMSTLPLVSTVIGEARPAAATADATCQSVDLPLPSGRVAGDLCVPNGGSDLLIVTSSGGTYGRVYWDLPYQPERYSFVHAMTGRGFAVLNVDRLGIGKSERPPSAQLTVARGARSVHEVVQFARAGGLDGFAFERIVLAGHSVGSTVTETEAATYHDVDALIVTGLAHNLNELNVLAAFSTFRPAALDPRFAGTIDDPGYITTAPETRARSFYHLPNADPAVVAIDEATKETLSLGELTTLYPFITPGLLGGGALCSTLSGVLGSVCEFVRDPLVSPTPAIDVPVFFAVGRNDGLVCGLGGTDCSSVESVRAAETPYWLGAPCLDVHLVPDAGHNLNLHRNAPIWYGDAADWLDRLSDEPGQPLGCPL